MVLYERRLSVMQLMHFYLLTNDVAYCLEWLTAGGKQTLIAECIVGLGAYTAAVCDLLIDDIN